MKKFLALSISGSFVLSSPSIAALDDVLGIWQLDNSLEEESGGSALVADGFEPAYTNSDINGTAATVLDLAPLAPLQTLSLSNPAGPNGSNTPILTNNWTFVMDVNFEFISNFQSLVQTNGANLDDVDIFVRPSGALSFGRDVSEFGSFIENQWYRLALTCGNDGDGGLLRCTAYIDGVQTTIGGITQVSGSGFDGVLALGEIVNLFSDDSGETDDMLVNSIAFWSEELSAGEVSALGGPSPTGIVIPQDPKICPTGLNATVTGEVPTLMVELTWDVAQGLDSTGIEVLINDGVVASLPPTANSFSRSEEITPNGGFVDLVYTVRMVGGNDSDSCDPLTTTVSVFTGELVPPTPIGLWNFNGDYSNDIEDGSPIDSSNDFSNDPGSFVATTIDGSPATVLDYTAAAAGSYFEVVNDAAPNGGGGLTNNFTIAFDVLIDDVSTNFKSFFQTNSFEGDVDLFLRPGGALDMSFGGPDSPSGITSGTWNRIVATREAGLVSGWKVYVNGIERLSHNAYGIDDIDYAIGSSWRPFSDDSGETGDMQINSLAFWDSALAPAVVAALGGASGQGLFSISTTPLAITKIAYNSGDSEVTITFTSKNGSIYALDYSNDLILWEELQDSIQSQGDETSITFNAPGGEVRQFYRVRSF